MNRASRHDVQAAMNWLAARNPVPAQALGPELDERARGDLMTILGSEPAQPDRAAPGRRRRVVLMAAAGGVVALAGLAGVGWFTHPIHRHLGTSWANAYPSTQQMIGVSDAVVVGRVSHVVGTTVDPDTGMRYTDFTFVVDSWIVGARGPASVTVHQLGSASGFVTEDVADDPLLRVGEHDVLFLSGYAPGRYFITGGPTGRFTVDGAGVHSLPAGLTQVTPGLSLTTFEQELQAAAHAQGKATPS